MHCVLTQASDDSLSVCGTILSLCVSLLYHSPGMRHKYAHHSPFLMILNKKNNNKEYMYDFWTQSHTHTHPTPLLDIYPYVVEEELRGPEEEESERAELYDTIYKTTQSHRQPLLPHFFYLPFHASVRSETLPPILSLSLNSPSPTSSVCFSCSLCVLWKSPRQRMHCSLSLNLKRQNYTH